MCTGTGIGMNGSHGVSVGSTAAATDIVRHHTLTGVLVLLWLEGICDG
jgi:hypothetical protein